MHIINKLGFWVIHIKQNLREFIAHMITYNTLKLPKSFGYAFECSCPPSPNVSWSIICESNTCSISSIVKNKKSKYLIYY